MTSLHVICGLGLHQSKILATPINWRLPEQLFCWPFVFWENTCGCVLGSWPRAFLSLASRGSVLGKAVFGLGLGFFFVFLALASSLVSSTPPLLFLRSPEKIFEDLFFVFGEGLKKNFWRPFLWRTLAPVSLASRGSVLGRTVLGLGLGFFFVPLASSLESSTPHLVMGLLQHRSLTHVRSNPLHTYMIKIILAAFLIAHVHLIQCVLFLSCSAFLCFFFYKTRANTQLLLPLQTGLYRYDEWCKKSAMKTLT